MDLSGGAGKLSMALKTLRFQWDEAKAHWNDSVAREFEGGQIQELEIHTLDTLREIDRLAQIMAKARHDCS
jgi:hypothetical protein